MNFIEYIFIVFRNFCWSINKICRRAISVTIPCISVKPLQFNKILFPWFRVFWKKKCCRNFWYTNFWILLNIYLFLKYSTGAKPESENPVKPLQWCNKILLTEVRMLWKESRSLDIWLYIVLNSIYSIFSILKILLFVLECFGFEWNHVTNINLRN